MTLRSRILIGLAALASFPLISSGTEMANTTPASPRVYSQVEIAYIQGLNCDTFAADAKARCLDIKQQVALQEPTMATGSMLPPPAHTESGSNDRRPPMAPPGSQTGAETHHMMPPVSQSGTTIPMPKPPMGTGANMGNPMEGIGMAIAKLTPTDREALLKMIREYLTSKGIDLTQMAGKREEIKDIKKETRETIKDMVKTTQNTIKTKREEMRSQIREIRQGSGSGVAR